VPHMLLCRLTLASAGLKTPSVRRLRKKVWSSDRSRLTRKQSHTSSTSSLTRRRGEHQRTGARLVRIADLLRLSPDRISRPLFEVSFLAVSTRYSALAKGSGSQGGAESARRTVRERAVG
jgi:hypothetical protein